MKITIPKCYLQPRAGVDKYDRNSYSKINNSGSIFQVEKLGYEINNHEKKEEYINLDVDGISYILDSRLADLVDEIQDSKYILNLEEGWEDNGAKISPNAYYASLKFCLDYSIFILNKHNILISTPEINPVRNGTIDLVWNTESAYLAINVKHSPDGFVSTFFLFKKSNQKTIEGEIDINELDEPMALWMTALK